MAHLEGVRESGHTASMGADGFGQLEWVVSESNKGVRTLSLSSSPLPSTCRGKHTAKYRRVAFQQTLVERCREFCSCRHVVPGRADCSTRLTEINDALTFVTKTEHRRTKKKGRRDIILLTPFLRRLTA
jgi:hypothetical protein